jgi:hypothetical protein
MIIGPFILNQNIFYTTNILFLKSIAKCPCVATSYLGIFFTANINICMKFMLK